MTRFAFLLAGAALAAAGTAQAEIVGEAVDYDVGGTTYEGYLAYNSDLPETRGTVAIVHDWDGLTDYERRRAEMLAALGYTAMALDLYGQGNLPQSSEENRELSGALYSDREEFRTRLQGSLKAVRELESTPEGLVLPG